MDGTAAVVTVIVALITAGLPAWVGLRKLRHENSSQHATAMEVHKENRAVLQRLDQRTEKIHDTLTNHLSWHAHEEDER